MYKTINGALFRIKRQSINNNILKIRLEEDTRNIFILRCAFKILLLKYIIECSEYCDVYINYAINPSLII